MLIKLRKAQNTAEYAIVLGLVVGAVVAMQVYVKRGLQGRYKQAVDTYEGSHEVADWGGVNYTKQYEPYYLESSADIVRDSSGYTDVNATAGETGGIFSKRHTEDYINQTAGSQKYNYTKTDQWILNETN
jgi:Flp pilus assembly pilin Flp